VKVTLRNLVIVPLPGGGGTGGVSMTNGARLTIEGCSISGSPPGGYGLYVVTAAEIQIVDSIVPRQRRRHLPGPRSHRDDLVLQVPRQQLRRHLRQRTSGTTTAAVSDTTITGLPNAIGVYTQGETGALTRVSVSDPRSRTPSPAW
jgi:hypothetical protein